MNENLKRFDLNLLLSLEALLRIRHVSKAADSIALTQSGMSKNLARLRHVFKDDLLVRAGNRMVLTPKAELLANDVASLLAQMDHLLAADTFDPGTSPMQFTIAASDFLMQLYFPEFLEKLLVKAPNLHLDLVNWSNRTISELESGQVDFLFGGLDDAPPGIYRRVLNQAGYVCITRPRHPEFTQGFSLESYLNAGHISIRLTGEGSNPVDDWLKKQGLQRNVVVRTPFFMSGVAMVSRSDLVMLIHAKLAEKAQQHYALDVFPIPLSLDMPPFGLFWHERTKQNPAHQWFREQVVSMLKLDI